MQRKCDANQKIGEVLSMGQLVDRFPVAIIGSGKSKPGTAAYQTAFEIGLGLATRGYAVLCGGRQGVMAAASAGCRQAGGFCIGLLPNLDDSPNDHCSIIIATDLGNANNPIAPDVSRNRVIVRAALCVFAVAGEVGTANELRFAWKGSKRVFGLVGPPPPEGYTEEATWGHSVGLFSRHGTVEDAFAAFDSFVKEPRPFAASTLAPRK
jgi:uncharacterized protein (TIGR00725 family)